MRGLLAFALLLALSAGANAQTVERVTVLDYGIFTAKQGEIVPTSGTATGDIRPLTDFKLVEQTETITAKTGLRFGISYRLVGGPKGRTVKVKWITRFPPGGVTNAKGETFAQNEFEVDTKIGDNSWRTYTFDEPWEMVAGDWHMEFWYGGRKVGAKRFTVVLP